MDEKQKPWFRLKLRDDVERNIERLEACANFYSKLVFCTVPSYIPDHLMVYGASPMIYNRLGRNKMTDLDNEIQEHAKTADELAFWKYQAIFYHACSTHGGRFNATQLEASKKILEHYQRNEKEMDAAEYPNSFPTMGKKITKTEQESLSEGN